MIKKIESLIAIPQENRISSVRTEEAEYIYSFLKKRKIRKTLEIGFGYGYSAAYIVEATGSKHFVVDPFQDRYQNLGINNMKNLGFSKRVRHFADYSHFVLPALTKAGEKFEYIFIDGGHRFDEVFLDFYYSDLLTSPGGFIMFHDLWMDATALVVSWIRKNRPDYRILDTKYNLVLIKKVGVDRRKWKDFEDFYPRGFVFREIKNFLVKKLSTLVGR